MAPITKAQAKTILAYVLRDILEDDEEDGSPGPIQLSFIKAKVKGILGLTSMAASTLEALFYNDTNAKIDVPLESGKIGLLKTFHACIYYHDSINDPMDSNEKWMSITLEQFQRFRVSKEWFSISENTGKLLNGTPSGMHGNSRDPAAEFQRGIKRDISLFPTLKQDKQWDVWQRAVYAQARAQDLIEVLTATYVPITLADQDLFREKQKYMYAVFEHTLLSDKGKALVREHTIDYEAQKVFKDLSAYSMKSTKATLDSSSILTYITSSRLGDGTWKGDTHSYLLHWQDQVRKYESLIPVKAHFVNEQKLTMLKNAVSGIPALRQVHMTKSVPGTPSHTINM
jgi:hypothetical protein